MVLEDDRVSPNYTVVKDHFMSPIFTAAYLDVFQSSESAMALQLTLASMFVFFGILAGVVLLVPKLHYRIRVTLSVICAVIAGGSGIYGFIDSVSKWKDFDLVASNMKHNFIEKYGYELKVDNDDVNRIADRSKPNLYTVIISSDETGKQTITQEYLIAFDRVTYEPFISDVPSVKAPTAEEIEQSVKK